MPHGHLIYIKNRQALDIYPLRVYIAHVNTLRGYMSRACGDMFAAVFFCSSSCSLFVKLIVSK